MSGNDQPSDQDMDEVVSNSAALDNSSDSSSSEVSNDDTGLSNATCVQDLFEHYLLKQESFGSQSVLYCIPCFEGSRAARSFSKLSVLDVQRLLNPLSKGNLSTGLLMTKDDESALNNDDAALSQFRQYVVSHLSGSNGDDHAKALENYTAKQLLKRRNTGFVQGLFRAALLEIESPRSMSTFKSIVKLIFTTMQSRIVGIDTNFIELCNILSACLASHSRDNIRRVLPSTGESALFTVLCDVQLIRSMGCVLLVARDKNGQPIAVPVESSVSYSDIKFKKADSDELAKQFIEDLRQASVPLNSLVGVVTEGYYSADAFANSVRKLLKLSPSDSDQLLPFSSDAAAALNDTVENNRCGLAYRCEDRAHKFECLHWHVDLPDTASPDCNRHYALNIYYEFEALATHYDKFYEVYHWRSQKYEGEFNNRDKRDMFGSDFVADLLCLIDLLGPIKSLIEIAQNDQLPHWKFRLLSGSVASYLAKRAAEFRIELYPSLLKAGGFDSIRPGGSYLGVPLVQGWNVGETPFTFDSEGPVDQKLLRSQADIERDVTEFAAALHRSFVQQVESYSASAPSIVNDAAVMDAGQILCLLASSDASAEVEALARSAAAERLVLAAAQHRQMSLVSTASVASYATAIQRAFISGDGREGWTTPCITGRIVKVELEPAEREGEFATCLRVTTESSDEAVSVRLNEDFIYKSLYFDRECSAWQDGTAVCCWTLRCTLEALTALPSRSARCGVRKRSGSQIIAIASTPLSKKKKKTKPP
ncbi:hypothetical protein BOX15_Mlig015288g4 [Macrostomum lignano]|uniref:Uncharacterized protein n=1 Tax=Macrostomum lignano TaxID=282301 RepID=A0A267DSW6_9PLAT|nr:hypothetical protein BOX15_Mlig015288g4 [Macrostomum lignano]